MMEPSNKKSSCSLASHTQSVNGARMHYYDEGEGDAMLFLHGMPTSGYLWRHIIPTLSPAVRCIAPDFIGMGQSDKPNITYSIFEHIDYIEQFIKQLGLKNLTLVLHGWGSLAGFEYARRHPDNVKAIAFYESHIKPVTSFSQLSLPVQQMADALSRSDNPRDLIVEQNYLVEHLLPSALIGSLSKEDMEHYRAPYPTPSSRLPLWQYVNELPLGGDANDVVNLIQKYSHWLEESTIPKLLLYAMPGFITPIDIVHWAKDHLKNLTLTPLDDALHFAQESTPEQFAQALLTWHQKITKK